MNNGKEWGVGKIEIAKQSIELIVNALHLHLIIIWRRVEHFYEKFVYDNRVRTSDILLQTIYKWHLFSVWLFSTKVTNFATCFFIILLSGEGWRERGYLVVSSLFLHFPPPPPTLTMTDTTTHTLNTDVILVSVIVSFWPTCLTRREGGNLSSHTNVLFYSENICF